MLSICGNMRCNMRYEVSDLYSNWTCSTVPSFLSYKAKRVFKIIHSYRNCQLFTFN